MRHSELVATLSMAIAREVRHPDSSMAYSAGLLHDIGKAIINAVVLQSGPNASQIEPFSDSLLPGAGVLELEQQIVGTDHQAVGRDLAQLWALPPELTEAISQHHSSQSTSANSLTAIVALANAVAGQVDDSYPEIQRASLNEPTMLPLDLVLDLARTALK
jgi:putative nucleotidyltransferase with HDIG domain